MPRIINWELAKHPMNWVIAFLMVFIVMIAVNLILRQFSAPATTQ